jgi:hypothetical protein
MHNAGCRSYDQLVLSLLPHVYLLACAHVSGPSMAPTLLHSAHSTYAAPHQLRRTPAHTPCNPFWSTCHVLNTGKPRCASSLAAWAVSGGLICCTDIWDPRASEMLESCSCLGRMMNQTVERRFVPTLIVYRGTCTYGIHDRHFMSKV